MYGLVVVPLLAMFGGVLRPRLRRWRRRRLLTEKTRQALIGRLDFTAGPRGALIGPVAYDRRVRVAFGRHKPSVRRVPLALPASTSRGRSTLRSATGPAWVTVEVDGDYPTTEAFLEVELQPSHLELRGEATLAFGALAHPLHRYMRIGDRIRLTQDRLTVVLRKRRTTRQLLKTIDAVSELSITVDPNAIRARLVHEAEAGAHPVMRQQAIRLLRGAVTEPEIFELLKRLAHDPVAAVAFESAKILEGDGLDTFGRLAEDREAPARVRVAALQRLQAAPWLHVKPVLTQLIADSEPQVAAEAFRYLARRDRFAALRAVSPRLRSPSLSPRFALLAIRELETIGFQATEDRFADLLYHPSTVVKRAAIEVIGRHGDITWQRSLLANIQGIKLPLHLEIAVRSAIGSIRARQRSGQGHLSVPKVTGGALSSPTTTE